MKLTTQSQVTAKLITGAHWFLHFIRFVLLRIKNDRCSQIASELTMTSMLSMVPLMTVVFNVFAAFPSYADMGHDIQNYIFEHFVPNSGEQINTYLTSFVQQASRLKTVGAVILVITALMLMRTVDKAFNMIWHTSQTRKPITVFLVYWAVLSLGPVFLGFSIGLTSYFTTLPMVSSAVEQFGGGLKTGVPFLLTCLALSLMYWIIPNKRVRARHAVLAGTFAAILFELAKKGFSFYVTQFPSYQFIFGALAAIPIFLIWMYLSWMIVLLGAEICHAVSVFSVKEERVACDPWVLAYRIVGQAWKAFIKGETVSKSHLIAAGWADDWTIDSVVDELVRKKWLILVEQDKIFLGRDLSGLSLHDFYKTLPWALPYSQAADATHIMTQSLVQELDVMNEALKKANQNRLVDMYRQE